MEIKNLSNILDLPSSSSEILTRDFLLKLLKLGLDAVNPFEIVTRRVQYDASSHSLTISNSIFNLENKHVRVIGAGKAVGRMAEAIETILVGVPMSGIISVPMGVKTSLSLRKIHCVESSHPLPSEINLKNTERSLEFIDKISRNDFVIGLISGGGSALWSAPIPPISINDLKTLNRILLHSGMSIHEINVIRKHVSRIKGGKTALKIPAQSIILLISDVIGDQVESIASGPFSPDPSTYQDVLNLFEKYKLSEKLLPESVYKVVHKGVNKELDDTPKPKTTLFSRFQHHIIGSNSLARQAIVRMANKIGLKVINEENLVDGDARSLGANLARLGHKISEENSVPVLYISGGEPIVKIKGDGIGGRNQEVVAAFLKEICTMDISPDISLVSFGTDGIDGNSKYAGALCDRYTIEVFREKNISLGKFQKNNDLTNFFLQLGKSLILLGPTGTNVMDIHLLIINGSNLGENIHKV
ncbi:MAG: glycerate kinase type-2 family protein [Candidatus Hodarchaeales archaeon]|jgi:glycerate-2-kinase